MASQEYLNKMQVRQNYRNLWHTDLMRTMQADTPCKSLIRSNCIFFLFPVKIPYIQCFFGLFCLQIAALRCGGTCLFFCLFFQNISTVVDF